MTRWRPLATQIRLQTSTFLASPIRPITGCAALAAVPGYKPPVLVVTEGELVTVRLTAPVPYQPG